MTTLEEILQTAERLEEDERLQVLAFAQGLAARHRRPLKPTLLLLEQAGALDPGHVDEIMAAIEDECERVDLNEW